MGSRAKYCAAEVDAFSKRARRIIVWKRGELKRVKQGFARRSRHAARIELVKNCHSSTLQFLE